ncbi:hypothetical protein OESDEN_10380 [Oesophagostomum dentatum]|uniref:Peptidase C1A papain C-terminal domain-containing protein n=1 Tax=Oesophagostomum dentatum TaxID=61180 RepID=A0A0B1T0W0_OESDE|nr:hypothetical protein OESDEN_10380 [Oesophagostomum dentatum]
MFSFATRKFGATFKVHFSDTDIIACCGKKCGILCKGGYTYKAFRYAIENGVCSGGRYGEKNVCKPYAFYPCGTHKGQKYYGPCPSKGFDDPKCRRTCKLRYPISYEKDKIYGESTK